MRIFFPTVFGRPENGKVSRAAISVSAACVAVRSFGCMYSTYRTTSILSKQQCLSDFATGRSFGCM
jgi:hypothetical protein